MHSQPSPGSPLPPNSTLPVFFTVSSVAARIQKILQPSIGKQFWLKAEISSGRERGGHFYCNLVETGENGKIIAQISCHIWRQSLDDIKSKFKHHNLTLDLSDGTVAGLRCSLSFHPQWGIAIEVTDADTSVALGELELRKQSILARLKQEGLFEPNKLLPLPFLPIRIGLITSSGSAACQDFLTTIQRSNFGFQILLADATVQGDKTERTVLKALDVLERLAPDVVVIIRGGGSKTDLSYLDNEAISRRIAGYRFPVWTGIGHEIDTSVLDYVANHSFKTPTAVAESIIAIFTELQRYLEGAKHNLKTSWNYNLQREKAWVHDAFIGIRQGTRKMLMYHISTLQSQGLRLSKNTMQHLLAEQIDIKSKKERLGLLVKHNLDQNKLFLQDVIRRFSLDRFSRQVTVERELLRNKYSILKAMNPDNIIMRGFAVVRDENGKIITSIQQINNGMVTHTTVRDGEIYSTVNSVSGDHT